MRDLSDKEIQMLATILAENGFGVVKDAFVRGFDCGRSFGDDVPEHALSLEARRRYFDNLAHEHAIQDRKQVGYGADADGLDTFIRSALDRIARDGKYLIEIADLKQRNAELEQKLAGANKLVADLEAGRIEIKTTPSNYDDGIGPAF